MYARIKDLLSLLYLTYETKYEIDCDFFYLKKYKKIYDIIEGVVENKYLITNICVDAVKCSKCNKISCDDIVIKNLENKNCIYFSELMMHEHYDDQFKNYVFSESDIIKTIDFLEHPRVETTTWQLISHKIEKNLNNFKFFETAEVYIYKNKDFVVIMKKHHGSNVLILNIVIDNIIIPEMFYDVSIYKKHKYKILLNYFA